MAGVAESSPDNNRSAHLDLYAAGMCTLCLVHCIVLPLAGTLLPIAGLVSEDELVHKILVLMAAPATLWLVYKTALHKRNSTFIYLALSGLTLLVIAAFVESLAKYEVSLTVAGATILGASHLQRWLRIRRYRRAHAESF
ncbi:MAG: MerC domain-containing protein [Gammaproteobacteria bacterium]|nr:MerC domain-containing protein [Gammaproteobacteria bacterium]